MNYYLNNDVCKFCGRSDEKTHLGKSSHGWKFTLQANGFKFYKNWKEMKSWLKGKKIYDEYEKRISFKKFVELVELKQTEPDHEDVCFGNDMTIVDGYKFYDCNFS